MKFQKPLKSPLFLDLAMGFYMLSTVPGLFVIILKSEVMIPSLLTMCIPIGFLNTQRCA